MKTRSLLLFCIAILAACSSEQATSEAAPRSLIEQTVDAWHASCARQTDELGIGDVEHQELHDQISKASTRWSPEQQLEAWLYSLKPTQRAEVTEEELASMRDLITQSAELRRLTSAGLSPQEELEQLAPKQMAFAQLLATVPQPRVPLLCH